MLTVIGISHDLMQTNSGYPKIKFRETDSRWVCANFQLAALRDKNRERSVINFTNCEVNNFDEILIRIELME